MSRILSRRAISGALFALAAVVAVNSFAAVNDAAAGQKPSKPASIMLQKDKPSFPDQRDTRNGNKPAAGADAQDKAADAWYKTCAASGGGISTNQENSGTSCIAPDGSTIW